MGDIPQMGGNEKFYLARESGEEWSWPFESFLELNTPIKIKIRITCVYKEYEVEIKIVHEQRLQLKIKFLLG